SAVPSDSSMLSYCHSEAGEYRRRDAREEVWSCHHLYWRRLKSVGHHEVTHAAVQASSELGAPDPDEEVEARVRRYIVEHGLRPGDRLPTEAEWASSLGTSRVVVREALRGLEAIGVIEARAGSGRYLRGFDLATAARAFA